MMADPDDNNGLQGYNPMRAVQEYQEKIASLKSIPDWLQKPALPKLPWLDALPWLARPSISAEKTASSWTRLINLGVHPDVASRATAPAAPSGQANEVPGATAASNPDNAATANTWNIRKIVWPGGEQWASDWQAGLSALDQTAVASQPPPAPLSRADIADYLDRANYDPEQARALAAKERLSNWLGLNWRAAGNQ